MTARQGPGGRIPNQGRQPQAPGIGRDAKRHDLEAGATPGLGGPQKGPTDLQQGDVQELEAGQRIVSKATQAPAAQRTRQRNKRNTAANPSAVPADAIDYLAGRVRQGTLPPRGAQEQFDLGAWIPLLRQLARNPKRSGPLATALIQQLSNQGAQAAAGNVRILDENALQSAIEAGFTE